MVVDQQPDKSSEQAHQDAVEQSAERPDGDGSLAALEGDHDALEATVGTRFRVHR